MRLKLGSWKVFAVGILFGLAAAAVQAYLRVQPEANGISFVGHPADLFDWITNKLGTAWPVNLDFVKYPVLTVVGVLIGSLVAAGRNKELRRQLGPVRNAFAAAIFGFLLANFGLLLGFCDMRASLMVAYGSALAAIGLAAIIIGILLAIAYSRLSARKAKVVQ